MVAVRPREVGWDSPLVGGGQWWGRGEGGGGDWVHGGKAWLAAAVVEDGGGGTESGAGAGNDSGRWGRPPARFLVRREHLKSHKAINRSPRDCLLEIDLVIDQCIVNWYGWPPVICVK